VQEIFLGARRPPRPGRWLRRITIALSLGLVAVVLAYVVFRRATAADAPSGSAPATVLGTDGNRLTLGTASLERVGELRVLRLAGDPYAIGFAEGRLLGRELGDGGTAFDASISGEEPASGLGGLFHELGLRWRFRSTQDGIAPDRRRELAGLAAGFAAAGLAAAPSYQKLLWRETALDSGQAPGSSVPAGGVVTGLAFAVGGMAPLGHTVVGRSFALLRPPQPQPLVVSFVYPSAPAVTGGAAPEGDKLAFARVGWAGDVGVVTGVNAEGIVVAVDPATTDDIHVGAAAPPVTHVARDILERAHSLDEAVAIVQAAHPLGSASFLLVDGKAGGWAVVERTPTKVSVARTAEPQTRGGAPVPKKPAAIGDVLLAAELAKDPQNDRARRTRAGGGRRARLDELLGRGVTADPAGVLAVLRDRRGKADARLATGSGSAIDDLAAAHAAVVDATALVLWVSEGPGATGPFRAFDLRHELLGEPLRAGLAGTLAPDPTVDVGAARSVSFARIEVAAAEQALRAGRIAVAAEHAARAMALAPELAEAHRVAGDAARDAGQSAAAAEHYHHYLDLGPADPAAESDVRAHLGLGGP
jgi:isopenicillin-N N-acyltransferase like protein